MPAILSALDAPTTVDIVSSVVHSDDIVDVVLDSVGETNNDDEKSAKTEKSSEHPI